jgi:hypothetical protein
VVACRRATPVSHPTRTYSCCRSCCQSASPSQEAQRHPTSAMSHRGDLDTSTSAPQILAPSPSRSRTWKPLRSGGRPVLTPERDAARAAPRPESSTASCEYRLHQSNHIVRLKAAQLGAARARRYRCRGCVPGSPPSLQGHTLYHPKYGLGAAYEAFIHIDQTPVWKVRFPYAPGGTQDYEVRQPEMERCLMAFKAQLSNTSKVNDPHQKK